MDKIKKQLIETIKKDERPIEEFLLITNEYTAGYGNSVVDILTLITQALIHIINENKEIDISIIDVIKEEVGKNLKNKDKDIEDLFDELFEKLGG
jgi:phosphatidate phosphatase PAH1